MKKKRWSLRTVALMAVALACGGLGCGGKSAAVVVAGDDADAPDAVSASRPPTGSADLDAWIVDSPWMGWTCEPVPRGPRLTSPHQTVRVCENDLLVAGRAAGGDGDFPVGAAAVKEMYYQGAIWAVTIVVRGKAGSGADKWFWWRKVLDGTVTPAITNASYGDAFCSGCHVGAAVMGGRDFIFTSLP